MNACSLTTIKQYTSKAYVHICWLLTILLVGCSISLYIQNDDITRMRNAKFHSTERDIYPSISICFGNVLDEEKLDARGINKNSYLSFLTGKEWNKTFFDVNFDEVSIDLEHYLLAMEVYKEGYNRDILNGSYFLFDNTIHRADEIDERPEWKPNFFQDAIPMWGMVQKCLTFDSSFVSHKTLTWMTIVLSRSAFQTGKRPAFAPYAKEMFSVEIHYPGQRYRYAQTKWDWDDEEPQTKHIKSYGIGFRITNMEVINERNTISTPCNDKGIQEDRSLKSYLIDTMNCTPPYWIKQDDNSTKRCSEQEHLQQFYNFDIGKYLSPCRRLNHINYDYFEIPSSYYYDTILHVSSKNQPNVSGSLVGNVSAGSFYVGLEFRSETYKEIVLIQQFDGQSLIGDIGGIVGMCVGFSLLQFPQLFANIVTLVKKCKCYQ